MPEVPETNLGGEFARFGEMADDTVAAIEAIVTYAREGAPEVPERLIRHAAALGGLVASALFVGDFTLGNTPATERLAAVQWRINAYNRRRLPPHKRRYL
jgi:hypothetical protein